MGIFKKLFGSKDENEGGYVNFGQSVYPVIRARNHKELTNIQNVNDKIISEPFIKDLVIAYVLRIKNKNTFVTEETISKAGLGITDVKAAAFRNLIAMVNSNCKIVPIDLSYINSEMKPFYEIKVHKDFNPSLMLINQIWDQTILPTFKAKRIGVGIPTNDTIVFANPAIIESFAPMKGYVRNIHNEASKNGNELTTKIYRYQDGKWL